MMQLHSAFIELTDKLTPLPVKVIQTTTHGMPSDRSNLFGGLNLGLHVGDVATAVHNNRGKLLDALQDEYPSLTRINWLNQVHGNEIVHITEHLDTHALDADAQITTLSGVGLAIMTADCVPVMIAAKADNNADTIVAAIHAGWQGITKNIIKHTIQKLGHQINLDNNTLDSTKLKQMTGSWHAWVGASIAQQNYEVDSKVRQAVLEVLNVTDAQADDLFQPNMAKPGHYFADLPSIVERQLNQCGIQNVVQSRLDSHSDERFYSYRQQTQRQQQSTGRMATIIFKT